MRDAGAGMAAVAAAAEAAHDPDIWSEVARQAAACLGGDTAAVGFHRPDGAALVRACPYTDPTWHGRYDGDMHARNHVWTMAARLPAGSAASEAGLGGREAYLKSDIFNEFIRPQGADSLLTLVLAGPPEGGVGLLTVGRRRGRDLFDREDVRHASSLASAIARTVRVCGLAGAGTTVGANGSAFDVLVTPEGRLLTRDDRLGELVRDGVATVRDGVLSVPLLPALATAIRATGRAPDGWPPPVGIAVGPVATGRGRLMLALRPGGARAPGAVRLTFRMLPEASRLERLRTEHGLTPRECDVARLIAEGSTLPEIARALRLRRTTVRTHVTRLFDKFGLRTQLALAVRLAALLREDER